MTANPTAATKPPLPAILFFLCCLAYSLWAVSLAWDNALLDDHPFRQTQTAITTYYMIGRPPTLAYETPVLGPPWALPFEFPVYQWLVAGAVTVLETPLDQTGRFISLVFFYLCLLPAARLLAHFRFSSESTWIILGLLLLSPLYLFWSRAFLMESTALFFSLSYLALTVAVVEKPGPWAAGGALVCGALAALVKITTFAVFLVAVLLVLAAGLSRGVRSGSAEPRAAANAPARSRGRVLPQLACMAFLVVVVPVVAGLWWTQFADGVKVANPFGQRLTSAALRDWNFGTLEQRWSAATWLVILDHVGLVIGHLSVLIAGVTGLLFAGRRRSFFGTCMILALSAPLVFVNLHYVHEYYTYANGIFMIAAVGTCLAALLERGAGHRRAALYFLVLIVAVSLLRFAQYYYPKVVFREQQIAGVSAAVQQITSRDDVIVILGCDWSPEIPYYSERRALMIPRWSDGVADNPAAYLRQLAGYRIGALVVKEGPAEPERYHDVVNRLTHALGTSPASPSYADDGYRVYCFPHPAIAVASEAKR
jgi:hypothetical protein